MDIYVNLELEEPINFQDVIIKSPSISEVIRYGTEEYNRLLLPYIVSLDSLGVECTDEAKEGIKNFDIVCSNENMKNLLLESLKYFCETESIVEVGEGFKINDKLVLNRDNFDEFGGIILEINSRQKPKVEKPPVFKNDRQKDIWMKIQEGRKRGEKASELKLEDIINFCEFGGRYHIPTTEIKTWTMWKLMNCYKSIVNMSKYSDNFSVCLANGDISPIEGQHWTDLLRVKHSSE